MPFTVPACIFLRTQVSVLDTPPEATHGAKGSSWFCCVPGLFSCLKFVWFLFNIPQHARSKSASMLHLSVRVYCFLMLSSKSVWLCVRLCKLDTVQILISWFQMTRTLWLGSSSSFHPIWHVHRSVLWYIRCRINCHYFFRSKLPVSNVQLSTLATIKKEQFRFSLSQIVSFRYPAQARRAPPLACGPMESLERVVERLLAAAIPPLKPLQTAAH